MSSAAKARGEGLVLSAALLFGLAPSIGLAGGNAVATAQQSATVAVSGSVGGAPEVVSFSGKVQIRSHLVRDPDFGRPTMVHVAIDLVDVVGKGMTSGARYASSAELVNSIEVTSNEVIEMTFPFHPESRKAHLVARSANLALVLRFDARNGAVISGSGRVSSIE